MLSRNGARRTVMCAFMLSLVALTCSVVVRADEPQLAAVGDAQLEWLLSPEADD